MMQTSPYKYLGVQVNALSIPELNSLIAESVKQNQKWIIANHNLHSLYLYHKDPKMQAFYALAEYIHIDSMPKNVHWQAVRFSTEARTKSNLC